MKLQKTIKVEKVVREKFKDGNETERVFFFEKTIDKKSGLEFTDLIDLKNKSGLKIEEQKTYTFEIEAISINNKIYYSINGIQKWKKWLYMFSRIKPSFTSQ